MSDGLGSMDEKLYAYLRSIDTIFRKYWGFCDDVVFRIEMLRLLEVKFGVPVQTINFGDDAYDVIVLNNTHILLEIVPQYTKKSVR
ncbi:MAG: hypothetical protein AAF639_42575 [Chloroflexota bacterium]